MLTYNIFDFTVETVNTRTGLAVAAKCLHQVGLLEQSMKSSLDILAKVGEQPLREISDSTLQADMVSMNLTLLNTPDDFILGMQENRTRKIIVAMKIYTNLGHVFHSLKPSHLGPLSLRMVELTMNYGLVPSSPFAFALYGGVLVAVGNIADGCRLGMYHCMC